MLGTAAALLGIAAPAGAQPPPPPPAPPSSFTADMFVSIARTTAPEGSPAPFWFRVTAINNGPDRWTGTIEVDLPHCCVGRSTHFLTFTKQGRPHPGGRRRVRIRVTVRLFDGEGGSVKRRGA